MKKLYVLILLITTMLTLSGCTNEKEIKVNGDFVNLNYILSNKYDREQLTTTKILNDIIKDVLFLPNTSTNNIQIEDNDNLLSKQEVSKLIIDYCFPSYDRWDGNMQLNMKNQQYIHNDTNYNIKDNNLIEAEYKPYVYYLLNEEFIEFEDNTNFSPKDNFNNGYLIDILDNIYSKSTIANDYFTTLNSSQIDSSEDVLWQQFGPGNSGDNESFFIHPTKNNICFSFPDMGNSYRSEDGGSSWTTLLDSDSSNGGQFTMAYSMDFSRQDANFGFAGGSGYLKKTNDLGKTWTDVVDWSNTSNYPYNIETLAVDPTNDDIWFAGAGDSLKNKDNYRTDKYLHGVNPKNAGEFWKTTDKGITWTKLSNIGIHENAEFSNIYINPYNTQEMLVATTYGMYKSTNGGNSFTKIESLENNNGDDYDLVYNFDVYNKNGNMTIYAIQQIKYDIDTVNKTVTSDGGIKVSNDFGNTWKDITSNISLDLNELNIETKALVNQVANEDNDYSGWQNFISDAWFASGRATGKYFKNSDQLNGKTVREIAPNLPTDYIPMFNKIVVDPTNPNKVYISHDAKSGTSMYVGDVWSTDNGGESWEICTRTGYAWEYDSVYWESRNQTMGRNVEPDHYNYHYFNEIYLTQGVRDLDINSKGEIYVMYRSLYKSSNDGESWKNLDAYQTEDGNWVGTGASNLPGKQIILDPRDNSLIYLVGGENKLFRVAIEDSSYKDGIISLENYQYSADNISMLAISPDDINEMYTLNLRQEGLGEVWKSTDGGYTWDVISEIFDKNDVDSSGVTKVVQKGFIIDPNNANNMYFSISATSVNEVPPLYANNKAAGNLSGIYKSTDRGVTWNKVTNGLNGTFDVFDLEFAYNDSNTIYAAASAGNAISISNYDFSNNGTNYNVDGNVNYGSNSKWNKSLIMKSNAVVSRNITGLLPNTTYFFSSIIESNNGDVVNMKVSSTNGSIKSEKIVGTPLIETHGIYFTTNQNETEVTISFEKTSGDNNVYIDNLIIKTSGGLYKSTDSGNTWSIDNNFPKVAQVNDVMIDRNNGYIYVTCGNETTGQHNGGIYVSTDNGKSYNKIFSQAKTVLTKVDPNDSSRLLTYTRNDTSKYNSNNTGVYYSENYGQSWTKINEGLGNSTNIYDVSFDPNISNRNTIWLTSSCGGFYKGEIKNYNDLTDEYINLDINKSFILSDDNVIIESFDESVVVVDGNTITAIGNGKTIVKIIDKNNSNNISICYVNVSQSSSFNIAPYIIVGVISITCIAVAIVIQKRKTVK